MKKGKFNIIIGGQAGSEAKGKLSGWLCDRHKPQILYMTASPNAGHTVIKPDGTKKVSYHLPIGSVMCDADIVLGPASLINISILKKEIQDLGIRNNIYIDSRASIITTDCVEKECKAGLSDIGSTLQGIGETRVRKLMRGAAGEVLLAASGEMAEIWEEIYRHITYSLYVVPDTQSLMLDCMERDNTILCEMTQGFDLDLEHGIHPRYCTSKMINPMMALAEAGIPPKHLGDVYGVIRPYPIRVNNRTGTSGPYAEAQEITWGDVAIRSGYPGNPDEFGEITTTTKLPRRVFEFSVQRYRKFIQTCNPNYICLNFANYLDWGVWGVERMVDLRESQAVMSFIRYLEKLGCPVGFVGTSPAHESMVDIAGA